MLFASVECSESRIGREKKISRFRTRLTTRNTLLGWNTHCVETTPLLRDRCRVWFHERELGHRPRTLVLSRLGVSCARTRAYTCKWPRIYVYTRFVTSFHPVPHPGRATPIFVCPGKGTAALGTNENGRIRVHDEIFAVISFNTSQIEIELN